MAYFTSVAEEQTAIGAENRRPRPRFVALWIPTRDPSSVYHLPQDLLAFHVPADSGALHGDALSGPLLAAGKGDDVGPPPCRGAVAAVRSGTLEAAVLPGRSRETLPAEAVQAGQEVGSFRSPLHWTQVTGGSHWDWAGGGGRDVFDFDASSGGEAIASLIKIYRQIMRYHKLRQEWFSISIRSAQGEGVKFQDQMGGVEAHVYA